MWILPALTIPQLNITWHRTKHKARKPNLWPDYEPIRKLFTSPLRASQWACFWILLREDAMRYREHPSECRSFDNATAHNSPGHTASGSLDYIRRRNELLHVMLGVQLRTANATSAAGAVWMCPSVKLKLKVYLHISYIALIKSHVGVKYRLHRTY